MSYSPLSSSLSQNKIKIENNNQHSPNSFISSPESNKSYIQQSYPFENNNNIPLEENNQQNFSMHDLNGNITTLLPNKNQISSYHSNQSINNKCTTILFDILFYKFNFFNLINLLFSKYKSKQ